jgi:sigma-B regulation protein RsbU (phosphoserine phosphatase)
MIPQYNNHSELVDLKDEINQLIAFQSKLINDDPPILIGGKIIGTSLPAELMGGDYYDIYPLENGKIRIIIGDVMGKGISAAMLTILTRGAFRSAAEYSKSPGEALSTINQALYKDLRKLKAFVTLFCADWDPETGGFSYSNAGHPLPIIISGRNKSVKMFDKLSGIMVGGLPNQVYKEESILLEQGDSVFFFTDGIVEAQNRKGELFRLDRLISSLVEYQENDSLEINQYVMESLNNFTEGICQKDDITMVLLTVETES